MKDSALFRLTGDQVVIRTPYHPRFVSDLKEGIPYEDRMWHPEDKTWEVSGGSYEEAMKIAERYFNVKVEVANG